ncbi:hypothetical protein PHLCEN_2v1389 [Hermanssonia centrifuga]|uniref:Uncharacterized protein n=1 Tax=Hermanssonia centrifuga TaxID=98765 RepID=A0A2R6S3A8_9APHY|nr:hypothetical protein PHLCEN_2v1389 [Hermanssonia centrifuga]
MDPLGTVKAVIGAINYLYAASEKIKENGEECKRFCTHASLVMELIQRDIEHTDGGSARVSSKLKRLSKYVI